MVINNVLDYNIGDLVKILDMPKVGILLVVDIATNGVLLYDAVEGDLGWWSNPTRFYKIKQKQEVTNAQEYAE